MNTGIPGIDPLRDSTEKPATEQVVTIHEQRIWAAQWTRFCRKLWKKGYYAASDIHARIESTLPKRRLSKIGKVYLTSVILMASVMALIWYWLEGRYVDLTLLWTVPLFALIVSLILALTHRLN